ncbi:MAG: hypothetical protein CL912_33120 [Deltaproteobacteria bacterium]|nr:hypothetical protein [Deltaproteobacteria bacterium]
MEMKEYKKGQISKMTLPSLVSDWLNDDPCPRPMSPPVLGLSSFKKFQPLHRNNNILNNSSAPPQNAWSKVPIQLADMCSSKYPCTGTISLRKRVRINFQFVALIEH